MTERSTRECDCCGARRSDVQPRGDGQNECLPCWRSALRYGHQHGLHTDGEADPTDPELDQCPDCPPMQERVRRHEQREEN